MCLLGQVWAQEHTIRSFLAVNAIVLTNSVTATNIMTSGSSNTLGTLFTNRSGDFIQIPAFDRNKDFQRLYNDVELWTDSEGRPPILAGPTNQSGLSTATLWISFISGAAANSAVTFTFDPVWFQGANATISANDRWEVSVTAVAGEVVNMTTNVPMWKWPGAQFLRLSGVDNSDPDVTGLVSVTEIQMLGFVPE